MLALAVEVADVAHEDPRAGERELVSRCVAGDSAAQRDFVRRYTALVWSLCLRAGLARDDGEDVCQEVFWKAFAALPAYRGEARLSTWLATLTLRRIVDYRRSPARRHLPSGAPADPGFPELPQPHAPSPEAEAAGGERHRRVRAAVEALAEPARSVLVAYYLGEMPVEHIARTLGMPEGTVKTHLHRGRKTLRASLGDLA